MKSYFAEQALLPTGWARNVRMEISEGNFTSVKDGSPPSGCEVLAGPVLPGMANLHSHAFQRGLRGRTETFPQGAGSFWSWRDLMYRFAARLEPEHMQAIAQWLYIQMLKAGYTSVCEFHYLHHDRDGSPFADPAEMAWRIVAAAAETGAGGLVSLRCEGRTYSLRPPASASGPTA